MRIHDQKGVYRYSVDDTVYQILQRLKQKITEEDQEAWVAFGGDTGSGKSLKAQHWMHVIYPGLKVNHICFDRDEFIEAVITAKKGTGIIADEGISIFFSRASMTKEGRLIAELVAQIRQKNLAIFLCIPEPLSLDWTVRNKLNLYVHVWENRETIGNRIVTLKGNAAVYPEMPGAPFATKLFNHIRVKKSNPMAKGKRPAPYCHEKGNPIGKTFKKPWYPVGEEPYRAKKEDVLKKYMAKKAAPDKNLLIRNRALKMLEEETNLSKRSIASRLEMPWSTFKRAISSNIGAP